MHPKKVCINRYLFIWSPISVYIRISTYSSTPFSPQPVQSQNLGNKLNILYSLYDTLVISLLYNSSLHIKLIQSYFLFFCLFLACEICSCIKSTSITAAVVLAVSWIFLFKHFVTRCVHSLHFIFSYYSMCSISVLNLQAVYSLQANKSTKGFFFFFFFFFF